MGRKGMKGFLKGVHKKHDSDDEAEAGQADHANTSAAAGKHAEQPKPAPAAAPKPAAPELPPLGSDSDSDGSGDEGGSKGPETRAKVLQRHKRELLAHKKVVQKLGAKKKDEAAKLTAELEARHSRELQEAEERERQQQQQQQQPGAGDQEEGGQAAAAAEGAAEQLGSLGLGAEHGKKPTKAQKRREKLAAQEAEREQRIADEQAALGPSDKAVEEERLRELLAPLRLGVHEIRADGHCMYRALEHQLAGAPSASSSTPSTTTTTTADYLALRRMAAAHIRSHPDDFIPFVYDEDSPGSPAEQLEAYCVELEGTAVWGGQLELGALAQVLRRQIKVHALGMPTVSLGDEHAANGVLQLCYLRHAFGLGEHYNSVVKLPE